MTLPNERTRAILQARDFLWQLMDSASTKGIPKEIRKRARSLLKHYPTQFEMELLIEKVPDIFGKIHAQENTASKD